MCSSVNLTTLLDRDEVPLRNHEEATKEILILELCLSLSYCAAQLHPTDFQVFDVASKKIKRVNKIIIITRYFHTIQSLWKHFRNYRKDKIDKMKFIYPFKHVGRGAQDTQIQLTVQTIKKKHLMLHLSTFHHNTEGYKSGASRLGIQLANIFASRTVCSSTHLRHVCCCPSQSQPYVRSSFASLIGGLSIQWHAEAASSVMCICCRRPRLKWGTHTKALWIGKWRRLSGQISEMGNGLQLGGAQCRGRQQGWVISHYGFTSTSSEKLFFF